MDIVILIPPRRNIRIYSSFIVSSSHVVITFGHVISRDHVITGSQYETYKFIFVYFIRKVVAIPPPNIAGTASQLKPTKKAAPLIP